LLSYLERAVDVTCSSCGKIEHGHISCPYGHYVCDACHDRDALKVIEEIAFNATSKDPFEISDLMMSCPGLPMLGCQHAYIAGGALMAALKNEGSRGITDKDIEEVFQRTQKQAHGGYCGLTGVCGIAPAIGACFSILTGSKCGTDQAQRITMEAVTGVSRAIAALTGPSCCKAYIWTSLEVAVEYLAESLGIILPAGRIFACTYALKHPHGCRTTKCPYFAGAEALQQTLRESVPASPHTDASKGEHIMEDKLGHLVQRALDLGADKAKIIDTGTVVVEEWVRWKCLYGCAFYAKDGYHPPCAPDAESTKKVMREYSKAIMLNSTKGKALTEAAVRLEGEAYHLGYYKSFAMTALSSGPEGST
jgi:Family of unknown function (DUF5714)/Predicted metal-binding protein (DUF2284)